jgi:hypothetical protein
VNPTYKQPSVKVAASPEKLPVMVLIIPMARGEVPISALVAKYLTNTNEIWHLMIQEDVSNALVAKTLAICAVDRVETILKLQLMPYSGGSAIIWSSGEIREGRGRFLAPWALEEIKRLSQKLVTDQNDYLCEIGNVLRQRPSKLFEPLTPGLIFADTLPLARVGSPPDLTPDISKSERVLHGLTGYQVAAQDYRRNRYLALLDDVDLTRRAEDIIANAHIVDSKGLVSLDVNDPSLRYWLFLINDLSAELTIRHGSSSVGWKKIKINPANWPASLSPNRASQHGILVARSPLPEAHLVKYGKRQFLEETIRTGRLRIAPASAYNDPSLNSAIRDDELQFEISYDPFVPFNPLPPGTMLLPPGRVPFRQEMPSNFFVHCLTSSFSRRLLHDFDGDACLLIRSPDVYLSRLVEAMREAYPEWHCRWDHVRYVHPLQVNPSEVLLPFTKHFRFAYQKEFRVVWTPPSGKAPLEQVFISLGSLEDIAELVSLSNHATE